MNSIAQTRIKKELQMFMSSPTPGISCSSHENSLQNLKGVIFGVPGTPFENGIFNLDIQIPERYPFEPPCVQFVTPIYHPNIDSKGRICLDTLKPPPQGTWKPILNLSSVLLTIRVLLGEPGKEDPLMADIWQEYNYDYPTYAEKAKQWTNKYARGEKIDQDQSSITKTLSATTTKHTKSVTCNDSNEKNFPYLDDQNSDCQHDVEGDDDNNMEREPSKTLLVLNDDTNLDRISRKRQRGLKSVKESQTATGSKLYKTV